MARWLIPLVRSAAQTGMATMNRWNLQVEAGRVEEASELLDEILKITASELPEELAEE